MQKNMEGSCRIRVTTLMVGSLRVGRTQTPHGDVWILLQRGHNKIGQ